MNVRNFLHARPSPLSVYISLSPRFVLIPLLHLISSEESQQAVWWLDPSNMAADPCECTPKSERWEEETGKCRCKWKSEVIWGSTEGNCVINTTTKISQIKEKNFYFWQDVDSEFCLDLFDILYLHHVQHPSPPQSVRWWLHPSNVTTNLWELLWGHDGSEPEKER